MKNIKVGQTVKIAATGQTAKVLKVDYVNKTAVIQTLEDIQIIALDVIVVITALQTLWLMIRSIFKKRV